MLGIKRIVKIILVFVNMVIIFSMSKVLAEDSDVQVQFAEQNMYDAVISQLPDNYIKERDETTFTITISQNDIGSITRLDLNNKNISSIVGIEKFTSLEYLDISSNKISEIKDLSGLTSLKHLDISNNQISKIQEKIDDKNVYYLKTLTSLEYLNMSNNKIDSLGGLNTLLNLKELYAYDNKIKSLDYIKGLTNLEKLNLSKNSIQDSEDSDEENGKENCTVTKLKNLKNLQELDLSHNNIKYLMGEIEENVNGKIITSNVGLNTLTNLEKLNLYDNSIHDLDGIEALTNLTELNLGENNEISPYATVENLDKLSSLTNLKNFNFSENHVPNILNYLVYKKNIENVEKIEKLEKLEYLQLEGNDIVLDTETNENEGIRMIANLTSLKVLNLYNNKIETIPEGFSSLSNLQELYLGKNSLKSLINICNKTSKLLELSNLKKLDISNNKYLHTKKNNNINDLLENKEMIKAIKDTGIELNYEYLLDEYLSNEYLFGKYVSDNYSILDPLQNKTYVTYEDFGAQCDGIYDDFIAIRNAHIYANEIGCEVRAEPKKPEDKYHIYKYYENEVIVKTNVDWNNATFIIHDEKIEGVSGRYKNIFKFTNTSNEIRKSITDIKWTIDKNTKKIPGILEEIEEFNNKGFKKYFCEVINDQKNQYIRYGSNADSGYNQKDYFIIDNEGNILNDIQWDFEKVTKINIFAIPYEDEDKEKKLIIKNGNFISNAIETKSEHKTRTWKGKSYYERNIKITDSANVEIERITHSVSYEDDNEELSGSYNGFINVSKCVNLEIKDSSLYTRKYADTSTYDLVLTADINVKCENITSNNIDDNGRWGITGTNYCKDVVFNACELNRIDAHRGIYNLTVIKCTLGCKGLRMTGQGELNVIGTKICADTAIELRPDYGSTWDGKVNIINSTYEYDGIKEEPRLISAKLSYRKNDENNIHDFGYNCKLPNLNIQNLTINMNGYNNTEFDLFYIDNVKIGGEYEGTEIENNTQNYIMQYLPQNINVNECKFENSSDSVNLKIINNDYTEFVPDGYNYVISDAKIFENGENIISKIDLSDNYKTNQNLKFEINPNSSSTNEVRIYKNELQLSGASNYNFNDNGKYKIEVLSTDTQGYEGTKTYEFEINRTPPELQVSYDKTELTNENVTVTIRANKEIQEVEGWERGEDRKTLTKVYTENTEGEQTVTVTDLYGNTQVASVEVNNINKEVPVLEVIYSTKELTNENVTVTIRANKEIQEVEGWTRLEDGKTLTKVYTENTDGTEIVTVRDLYGNTATANVIVRNIDKEAPVLEVSYSTKELTNENVTVTIRANKEIQEVEGWTRLEDGKTLTKEYTENTEGTEIVTVTDLYGNTATANVEANNIDKEAPVLEVSYSTKELTNENVTVTIRANKEIQEVEGWTRLEDGKTLTKEYTENTEGTEIVTVTDLYGNTATASVDVDNIDKNALILEVSYSTKELTNENVTVTIRANKEIQEVEGWTRLEDGKTLTKVYTQNTEETVTVTDLYGNIATARVEVNNIDKEALTLEVLYSTEELTSENVTVTIKANKEIQEVAGWKRGEDRKTLTKVYTQNTEETVTVTDLYGNIATARVEVNNIDKEALTLEVLYSIEELTSENVTVTIKANKEIQEVNGWTRGEDRKTLTKVYTVNAKETVTVRDLFGNTAKANVEVNNIHKTTPIEEDSSGGGKEKDSSESKNSKISTASSTEKNSILPKTGNRNIIIMLLVIVSVIAIVLFVRYRNIKDI